MKRNIRKHIENVVKYKGAYYFDRNLANLAIKFDEETNSVAVSMVSYEDSEQQREIFGSAIKVSEIVDMVSLNQATVRQRNTELKADYLQLVDEVKETGVENIVFNDKNTKVRVALSDNESYVHVSLDIDKAGWGGSLLLYNGPLSASAVKTIRKAIHTGLCIQKGNKEVISLAYESMKYIAV